MVVPALFLRGPVRGDDADVIQPIQKLVRQAFDCIGYEGFKCLLRNRTHS